jgi:ABC-type transporter Mla maintaining outer membrane lipid asymmetry ATPase subunit MlaF
MAAQPVVELDRVSVAMDDGRTAEFSFAMPPGELLLLLGPNRSGKSLVLKLCVGLVFPDEGAARVFGQEPAALDDEELARLRRRIGVVLPQPGLRSNMTLYANVALPIVYHTGVDYADLRDRVMPLLDRLGLASVEDKFPSQLTAGEAKCGALARALIMDPELLLIDEPTAGLDAEMVQRVEQVLLEVRRARPVTMLLTMHAPSPLLQQADRVAFIRGGRIESLGRYADMAGTQDRTMQAYLAGRV